MAKNKLINSGFWSDPFIEDLTLQEKALFLYFITNELVSLSGIYPISKKRICFDTEINKKKLNEMLKKFSDNNKICWVDNFIIVVNFLKYQKPNPKMIIAIEKEFFKFPFGILLFLKDNLEKFDSLSIGYAEIEIALDTHLKTKTNTNIKTNIKTKDLKEEENPPGNPPKKKGFIPPTKKEVQQYFFDNGYTKQSGLKAWEYYEAGDWKDSTGKPVKSWKQKMRGVWFKDKNLINNNKGKLNGKAKHFAGNDTREPVIPENLPEY